MWQEILRIIGQVHFLNVERILCRAGTTHFRFRPHPHFVPLGNHNSSIRIEPVNTDIKTIKHAFHCPSEDAASGLETRIIYLPYSSGGQLFVLTVVL